MEVSEESLEDFFSFMLPILNERQRRLLAGATARMFGRGGATVVARASGMSRNTVINGTKAVNAGEGASERVRREGGGRPRLVDADPELLSNLGETLIATDTLRRRYLRTPGRLTRSARKPTLHLLRRWPWAERFNAALAKLRSVVLAI